MEIALVCVLVGVGRLIGVKVDASELVVELKHLIQTKRPEAIRCSADQLELYLAKRSGVWLSTDSEEFKAMRKGEIPDMIKELMQDHLRMGNVDQLDSDECFGTNFQPGGREVHFLVKLPGATQHATTAGPSTTRTESRLKRWRELSEIYDETKKSRANSFIEKTDGETSDSSDPTDSIGSASSEPIDSTLAPASVGWSDVEDVFDPIDGRLAQILKPIPDDVIDALAKNVTIISRVTRGFLDMSVGVQRQLIGPVLITICNLFDDMKLDFDRTVTGNQIHAQIQLDFVFTRGKKTKMCVAHAKHGDFEQARAQVLVASEAIAEREDQHVVYGLVTDFVSWHLFRSGEKSIAMDGRMMYVLSGELDKASLRDVCEMIYGALADHEEEDKRDHQLAMHERYSLY